MSDDGYMTTFSGRRFRFDAPNAESICAVDIAHALANLCHWGGHCREFFSVAQHSVLVSRLCPPALARWGLLHDAAEAYLGDMIRPVKVRCDAYRALEKRVMSVIAGRFGLEWPEPPALKAFDNLALKLEADFLMTPGSLHDGWGKDLGIVVPPDVRPIYRALAPAAAKAAFLERYDVLGISQ